MAISMLKIRRPLGRLIFNMGIATPGKTVFLIETAPRSLAVTRVYIYIHIYLEEVTDKSFDKFNKPWVTMWSENRTAKAKELS